MPLFQIRHLDPSSHILGTGGIKGLTHIAPHKKKSISVLHYGDKFVKTNNTNLDVLFALKLYRAPWNSPPGFSSGRGASHSTVPRQLNRANCRTCGAMSATSARTEGISLIYTNIMNTSLRLSSTLVQVPHSMTSFYADWLIGMSRGRMSKSCF